MIDVVELISYKVESDLIGNQHEIQVVKKTYCEVRDITQTEYYRAKELKIGVKYCLVINSFDYNGEKHARFKGKKLKVHRTYTKGEKLELYVGD